MPVDQTRKSWKPGDPWEKAIEDIHYVRGLAKELGGPERVKRQHDGGRHTVRERIHKMVDPGSFMEAGPMVGAAEFDEDGNIRGFTPGAYVMGLAEIDGRPVAIGGDDFTISGGSPHNVHKGARQFTQPLAIQYGIPYIQLVEGVGHSSKSDEAVRTHGPPRRRPVVAECRTSAPRAGRGGCNGIGRGRARRLRPHVPLHRDDKGTVPDFPLRTARRATRHRRNARQGGTRRLSDARPRQRTGG